MKTFQKDLILVLIMAFAFAVGTANADGPDGDDPCSHPNFVTHECLDSVLAGQDDGEDGSNGEDGSDGNAGLDGTNGLDGVDGRDGVDGKDAVIPEGLFTEYNKYIAAASAAQIYLPQDQSSRVTFGASHVAGETGYGLGYAYRCEDCERAPALTVSIGQAGSETAYTASIGWEF